MTTERDPRGLEPEETTSQAEETAPADGDDTEGHMMLPDGTGRWLARDRERDVRKHLSGRQLERQARDARKRK